MPQQKPQVYSEKMTRLRQAGLPLRTFLYTMDQIADLIQVPLDDLLRPMNKWVYFHGINSGIPPRGKLRAHNIGLPENPDWRVSESDFVLWMEQKGWRIRDDQAAVTPSDKEDRS